MRSLTILILALSLASAFARPALAANTPATAAARLVKPMTLSKVRDLDFGTLTFDTFSGPRTISLTQSGSFSCAANIVCSGLRKTARFNIKGIDGLTADIRVTSTSLTDGIHTIPFTVDAPLSVNILKSSTTGVDFDIGGAITVLSTLNNGTYSGTMSVTADYK